MCSTIYPNMCVYIYIIIFRYGYRHIPAVMGSLTYANMGPRTHFTSKSLMVFLNSLCSFIINWRLLQISFNPHPDVLKESEFDSSYNSFHKIYPKLDMSYLHSNSLHMTTFWQLKWLPSQKIENNMVKYVVMYSNLAT